MTDQPQAAPLQLYLLGGFRLLRDGAPIDIPSRKARALLCRLAVEPGVFRTRRQLANLLWPDSDPPAARQSLRQTLADLRRALKPVQALNTNQEKVAIDRALLWCDVDVFLSASNRSDVCVVERALARYQGQFLEGTMLGLPQFDEWLDETREQLRQHAVVLCELLIERCDLDTGAAIALHKRLLQLEPTLERTHRSLMEIYISEGDDAAAIKQYLSCQADLERELGVTPDADTTSLYQALLEHRARDTPKSDLTVGKARSPIPELRPVAVLALRYESIDANLQPTNGHRQEPDAHIAAIARQYGGRLLPALDQTTVVLFGLDTAHGTEVDRARMAAEALSQSFPGAAYGIGAGQVAYESDSFNVVGEPLTHAIELAHAAGSGQIWLTDAARHALRVRLTTERVAPRAWRLLPTTPVGAERAPIIGRELELRQFKAALDACRELAKGCVLLVRGEAGIGKSRLLEAFRTLCESEGFRVCLAQILDFGAERGADVIAQLTRCLAGLRSASDDAEPRLSELIAQELLPFARDMLGLDLDATDTDILRNLPAGARVQKAATVLHQLLRQRCHDKPVLLLIEDIHWAEALTIDGLARLAAAVHELPVLLVVTTRIDGEPLDPKWRDAMQSAPLVTLNLQPLSPAEAAIMARRLGVQAPKAVQQLVLRADGIPLFMEQLVAGGLATETVPTSIQSLVVARFDALPQRAQRALTAASVVGQHFSEEAISAVLGTEPDLDTLARHRLVRESEHGWQFCHALIREGVYQHLLENERAQLHRNAAAYYQGVDPVLYARHLDLARSPLAGQALLEAARIEYARLRPAWALPLLERVLEHYPLLTHDALILQGDIQRQMGYVAKSRASFDRAMDLATADLARARSLLGRGVALDLLDQLDAAIADLTEAARLAEGHDELLADVYLHLGNALFPLDDLDACLAAHQTSLRHAELSGETEQAARAEGGLGDAYYQRAAMRSANLHYRRCVEIAEAHQHLAAVPGNLAMQGVTTMFVGDMRTAVAQAERALALSTQTGDLRHELVAHNAIGMMQIFRGDIESGIHHAGWAVDLAEQLGSRRFQIDSLGQLAHLYWCQSDREGVNATIEQGMGLLTDELMPFGGPYLYGLRALTAATAAERNANVAEGLKRLEAGAVSHSHLLFYVTALQAGLNANDKDQVQALAQRLRHYTRAEPLPWADFFVDRAFLLTGLFADSSDKEHERLRRFAQSFHLDSLVAALP